MTAKPNSQTAKPVLHINPRGILCYTSTEPDQSWGMGIPVDENWNHNFLPRTAFYAAVDPTQEELSSCE